MKQTKNFFYLFFVIVLSTIVWAACPADLAGTGELIDPCQIENCTQLQNMSLALGANYSLVNDIDCSDTVNWNSGKGFDPIGEVVGSFDGKNNTISDLFINRTGEDNVGMFSDFGTGILENVGLINVNISGGSMVAGLSANNFDGILNKTYVTGNIRSIGHVGGVVGDCGVTAKLSNSYFIGKVTNTKNSENAGGFISDITCNVDNVYVNASIISNGQAVGGVVGSLSGGYVNNSFFVGNITNTTEYTGHIAGYTLGGWIDQSYYNNQTENMVCIGGNFGGGVHSCTPIQDNEAYFYNVSEEPLASWDTTNVWDDVCSTDQGYPFLLWQNEVATSCSAYVAPATPSTTATLEDEIAPDLRDAAFTILDFFPLIVILVIAGGIFGLWMMFNGNGSYSLEWLKALPLIVLGGGLALVIFFIILYNLGLI